MEKLVELSRQCIDDFIVDRAKVDAWRYHQIRWTQEGIPIQREEVTWLDRYYLENAIEYPFYQFQISAALGRVVGFWDEASTFNVILLDPLHNMQPLKVFNYTTTPTGILRCQYTSLLFEIKEAQSTICENANCEVSKILAGIPAKPPARRVLILQLEDHDYQEELAAIDLGTAESLGEIIAAGIASQMNSIR